MSKNTLKLKLDKATRKVLRENAEHVLNQKGLTLDEYIDQKCLELVALTPITSQSKITEPI